MKNKWTKKVAVFLAQVIIVTILMMMVSVVKDGMYLLGVPSISNVQRVTITYPQLSSETKEVTDPEHIELAVKLTGFLNIPFLKKRILPLNPKSRLPIT